MIRDLAPRNDKQRSLQSQVEGLMQISSAPARNALTHLGQ
jgi:hypothetical protein